MTTGIQVNFDADKAPKTIEELNLPEGISGVRIEKPGNVVAIRLKAVNLPDAAAMMRELAKKIKQDYDPGDVV